MHINTIWKIFVLYWRPWKYSNSAISEYSLKLVLSSAVLCFLPRCLLHEQFRPFCCKFFFRFYFQSFEAVLFSPAHYNSIFRSELINPAIVRFRGWSTATWHFNMLVSSVEMLLSTQL